ncbi:C39 family peptidase [Pantanalinema sp. GBBB05]|uniref:C39 family peptidase n=1 Tax=Pantanalinema sp. GBBB05 TaxID=2604139 RepID=UPI001DBF7423|nr:hypothetical protein [Pantanalinema sp. GBBB05]
MTEILLKDFPLLPQLDNEKHPYGSCNMTCVAMCLRFLGKSRSPAYAAKYPQLEDELQQRTEDNGWDRHDPQAMKRVAELYGVKDELLIVFGKDAIATAITKTIAHLKAGLPAITHTYLTQSGHIVCLSGVRLDSAGNPVQWHITDPYGEFYPDGYEKNYGGDPNLGKYWLSHSTFTRLILADGQYWVHLIK